MDLSGRMILLAGDHATAAKCQLLLRHHPERFGVVSSDGVRLLAVRWAYRHLYSTARARAAVGEQAWQAAISDIPAPAARAGGVRAGPSCQPATECHGCDDADDGVGNWPGRCPHYQTPCERNKALQAWRQGTGPGCEKWQPQQRR
jgi:hypothetical protein